MATTTKTKDLEEQIKELRAEIEQLKGQSEAKTAAYFCIRKARYGDKVYTPKSILYQGDVRGTPPVSAFRPMDERGAWVTDRWGNLVPRKSHETNTKRLLDQEKRFAEEKRQDIEARKSGVVPPYKLERGIR